MNIPPIIGLILSLSLGIVIGSVGTYQYYSKKELQTETIVRSDDNKNAKKIEKETKKMKEDKSTSIIVEKYKEFKENKCKELTNEEIISMCINQYVPDDLLQSIQNKISRARGRTN